MDPCVYIIQIYSIYVYYVYVYIYLYIYGIYVKQKSIYIYIERETYANIAAYYVDAPLV